MKNNLRNECCFRSWHLNNSISSKNVLKCVQMFLQLKYFAIRLSLYIFITNYVCDCPLIII